MRPETKERADTTVGPVLRGSFTFYQATAGDVEEGGMRRGREEEEEGAGKKGVFKLRACLGSRSDPTGVSIVFLLQAAPVKGNDQ